MMKRTALGLCLILVVGSGWAQYTPLTGAEQMYDLYSPQALAEGGQFWAPGPGGDAVNPAASATVQRTTVDASYLVLSGF